ncbi:hypothetical protein RCOM_1789310, partial [Ricinus communis]
MAVFKQFVSLFLVSALLITSSISCVYGRFVVEKSSISVLSPLSLRSKHDSAIGNFGIPDYGGFMVGSAMYPDKGASGCQAFDGDKPFRSKSPRPTILLLDRG